MQIVEAGLDVLVVAAVADGVQVGHVLGISGGLGDIGDIAPGIVGVGGNFCGDQFAIYQLCLIELDDIALQVGQAVVGIGLAACLVAQGGGVLCWS